MWSHQIENFFAVAVSFHRKFSVEEQAMCASKLLPGMIVGLIGALFAISQVMADDPQMNPNTPNPNMQNSNQAYPQHSNMQAGTEGGDRTLIIKTLPSKKLAGASVDNTKGEKLGTIDDLVIDLESGKVAYAAISVGGVLGIGDKLFAVPFEELRTTHDTNNNVSFVLDVSKQRLENAPGFDKNHWPDFASPQWRNQIDTYYRQSSASRPGTEPNTPESR
jgi:sporulation protein YlmC with PRC-barrel domain